MTRAELARILAQTHRDEALLALRETPDATSSEIGQHTAYLWTLEQQGWVRVVGYVVKAGSGRPANLYRLTEKGRKRASKLACRDAVRPG